jgi:putative ABC transport system permease protein
VSSNILPRADEIHIDPSVLLFTAAVAIFTGVLFGLGPAMHSARVDLNDTLKAGGRGIVGGGKLRGAMIAAEVALAMILLTGAGLLMRSFLRLENVDPGFRTGDLVTMRVSLAAQRYPRPEQRSAFYDRLLERVQSIPGVRGAAIANALPVQGRAIAYFFNIEGRPALESTKAPVAWMHSISPDYFQTLGIPVLAGRAFNMADTSSAPLVAMINQTMARRFWPNEDPIGKRIIYSREGVTVQIVGVTPDLKIGGLGDNSANNILFVPYRQRPFLSVEIVARGPSSIAQDVRREVLAIDRDQPVANVRTMSEVLADSMTQPHLRTALIGGFAALALTLAAIGIGGMVAWSVTQRTNEIGIRMALGARPADVFAMILRQAFTMVGAGQLAGLAGALALTRVLSNFLFGVSPEDPATFLVVTIVLACVAFSACVFAARRALRIDPLIALRLE